LHELGPSLAYCARLGPSAFRASLFNRLEAAFTPHDPNKQEASMNRKFRHPSEVLG